MPVSYPDCSCTCLVDASILAVQRLQASGETRAQFCSVSCRQTSQDCLLYSLVGRRALGGRKRSTVGRQLIWQRPEKGWICRFLTWQSHSKVGGCAGAGGVCVPGQCGLAGRRGHGSIRCSCGHGGAEGEHCRPSMNHTIPFLGLASHVQSSGSCRQKTISQSCQRGFQVHVRSCAICRQTQNCTIDSKTYSCM